MLTSEAVKGGGFTSGFLLNSVCALPF